MSRVASGWIPNRTARDNGHDSDANEEEDEESHQRLANQMETGTANGSLAAVGAQRESYEQRQAWGIELATGQARQEPKWPNSVAHEMPKLTAQAFIEAYKTFPIATGLGWGTVYARMRWPNYHSEL